MFLLSYLCFVVLDRALSSYPTLKMTEMKNKVELLYFTKMRRHIGFYSDTLSDNISEDKIFSTKSKFRHFCPTKFFSAVSYFPIQFTRKISFKMSFVLI